jgi:hypothetical protein
MTQTVFGILADELGFSVNETLVQGELGPARSRKAAVRQKRLE